MTSSYGYDSPCSSIAYPTSPRRRIRTLRPGSPQSNLRHNTPYSRLQRNQYLNGSPAMPAVARQFKNLPSPCVTAGDFRARRRNEPAQGGTSFGFAPSASDANTTFSRDGSTQSQFPPQPCPPIQVTGEQTPPPSKRSNPVAEAECALPSAKRRPSYKYELGREIVSLLTAVTAALTLQDNLRRLLHLEGHTADGIRRIEEEACQKKQDCAKKREWLSGKHAELEKEQVAIRHEIEEYKRNGRLTGPVLERLRAQFDARGREKRVVSLDLEVAAEQFIANANRERAARAVREHDELERDAENLKRQKQEGDYRYLKEMEEENARLGRENTRIEGERDFAQRPCSWMAASRRPRTPPMPKWYINFMSKWSALKDDLEGRRLKLFSQIMQPWENIRSLQEVHRVHRSAREEFQ